MKLLFSLYSFVELNHAPHGNCHAVSVLPVRDIKRCSTILHFAYEEWEVYLVYCYEEEGIINGANE